MVKRIRSNYIFIFFIFLCLSAPANTLLFQNSDIKFSQETEWVSADKSSPNTSRCYQYNPVVIVVQAISWFLEWSEESCRIFSQKINIQILYQTIEFRNSGLMAKNHNKLYIPRFSIDDNHISLEKKESTERLSLTQRFSDTSVIVLFNDLFSGKCSWQNIIPDHFMMGSDEYSDSFLNGYGDGYS